jgi:hypothetical protein
MVWINSANNAASHVQIVDPIPAGMTYVPGSLECDARGDVSTTTTCTFDEPNNRTFWEGTIGPDLGATNEGNADNEVVILFRSSLIPGVVRVTNVGTATSDTDGDGDFEDETPVSVSVTNVVSWVAPLPTPSVSLVGLIVALAVLTLIAAVRVRRSARR